MYRFSKRSMKILSTVHGDLQDVFLEVIKHFDCTIICGHRNQQVQDEAFYSGQSKVKYPNSKHNKAPSLAVDAAPYPINWNDSERFYYFAGFVFGIATRMGIELRWGGDWDRDNDLHDQTFMDLVHFELVNPRNLFSRNKSTQII